MINFFRKIRVKLLIENRFSRYFLYAIGEVLLVMIGILLALKVNNTNEDLKNRAMEKAYLADIHEDFIDNRNQFQDRLESFNNQFQIADSLCRQVFPITDTNWKDIKKIYGRAFLPYTFNANRSSINAIISSGRSNIITNEKLKKMLITWNDKYEDYKENEDALMKLWDTFRIIRISEPYFDDYRINTIQAIPYNVKYKLEQLMRQRRAELGLIISRWDMNQESKQLLFTINSIISLTEPYLHSPDE